MFTCPVFRDFREVNKRAKLNGANEREMQQVVRPVAPVFVVFHCRVLLCTLALCVYLCVGLLYIDIVYYTTVLHCIFVCGCQLA